MGETITKLGIVGAGLIGASWAALASAHGLAVSAYDPKPEAEARFRDHVAKARAQLAELGLTGEGAIAFSTDLAAAHSWPTLAPEVRLLHLVSEVGEVADALRAVIECRDMGVDDEDATAHLLTEIYDVIWNACDLASLVAPGVNLDQVAEQKHSTNLMRRWD